MPPARSRLLPGWTSGYQGRFSQNPISSRHLSHDTRTLDWSAKQYLKFEAERTRPARDLLAQVPLNSPRRVVDLGCGPGNSTAVLREQYPGAILTGLDSSPAMLDKARESLPDVEFHLQDLETYAGDEGVDLFYSNAVFQWIKYDTRVPIIKRLIRSQASGSVFAFQVPDNFLEKSHMAMRSIAEQGPWADKLRPLRPSLDPMQTPQALYNELKPLCSQVNLWHTYYQHALDNHEGVVEWVKGTGLRPFLEPLVETEKEEFIGAYLQALRNTYPLSFDGKVLLRYPRLFMVAVRA